MGLTAVDREGLRGNDFRVRRRRADPRRIKINRAYTIEGAARTLSVHKNTVREWLKRGLDANDARRPTLILGRALRHFLEVRRAARKQPCAPGTIYCVRCRTPRRPAGDMVDFVPITAQTGDLRGICPVCEALMHRLVSLTKLDIVAAKLDVAFRSRSDDYETARDRP